MFGKLGDMAGMLKKAQEMQKNMKKVQDELKNQEVSATSGNNKVTAVATCDISIKRITISSECLQTNDPEIIENLVTEAVNNAIETAKTVAQSKMAELTGGLDIPGL